MADEESSESPSEFWPQLLGQHGEHHGNQPKGGKAIRNKPQAPKANSKAPASSSSSKGGPSYFNSWLVSPRYPSTA
eukprot:11171494-Lingulodinium_polyedra.AAC.1